MFTKYYIYLLLIIFSISSKINSQILLGGYNELDLEDAKNSERCLKIAHRALEEMSDDEEINYKLFDLVSCHTQTVAGRNWSIKLKLFKNKNETNYHVGQVDFFQSLQDEIEIKNFKIGPAIKITTN
jgi:hypothetical protein